MPRAARRKSDSGIYHAVLRGINKQVIFEEDEDYQKFLEILVECRSVCGYQLLAYCLMSNHIHLLLKVGKEDLDKIFRRIGARFVYWYNTKYSRVGHLFQDRFKSEPVEDENYFLTVLRYIHLNPVKAGICTEPSAYPYSSYPDYWSEKSLADTEMLMDLIDRETFEQFHEAPNEDRCMDVLEEQKLRVTDETAKRLMKKYARCENTASFQALPEAKKEKALRIMLAEGVSIRQASRITGISFGIVRKYA